MWMQLFSVLRWTLVYIEKAAYAFKLNGEPVSCEIYGHGHINQTFKIDTNAGAEYILQRINKYVFKDPERLMENVAAVTEYLRERVEDCRNALHFVPANDGKTYHVASTTNSCRATRYKHSALVTKRNV